MTARNAWIKLHRWIGLAIALWLVAVSLTGSLLAFRGPIESLLGPGTYLAPHPPAVDRFDLMVARIAERYPDREIVLLQRDGLRPDESFRALLTKPAATRPHDVQDPTFHPVVDSDIEVFVDPETGRILGERPFWHWMEIAYSLHTELLAPIKGPTIMGILGFFLLFLAISGPVIWWPRPGRFWKSFRIHTGYGVRRLLHDLHLTGGAVVSILIISAAITGLLICYESAQVRALAALGLARISAFHAPVPGPGQNLLPVQTIVDRAMADYPDADPVNILFPWRGRGVYQVRMFPRHETRVFWTLELSYSAVDGSLVHAFDPHQQPAGNSSVLWVIFLHNGQMFGTVGRFLVLCAGLMLAMLVVTGPWLWLLRKKFVRQKAADKKMANGVMAGTALESGSNGQIG